MTGSLLNCYLLTNKVAVRTAIKLSVSVWGALIIAMLMNFEHPVWSMITGMISFFAPDHAQVVKKCLFQCIATTLGGLVGLALMSVVSQAPLMTAFGAAAIIFIAAVASYHTRDGNVTFCCAIFSVTIPIIIMVPGFLGPTSETFVDIFIDRVGAILVGIAWAGFISAALWPIYSTEALRGTAQKLVDAILGLNSSFAVDDTSLRAQLGGIYGGLIGAEDLADHCAVEGHWGRRAAHVAREMNRVAIDIVSDSYALHQMSDEERRLVATEIAEVERTISLTAKQGWKSHPQNRSALTALIPQLERAMQQDGAAEIFTGRSLLLSKLLNLAVQIRHFLDLFNSLMRAEHVSVRGPKIKRYKQTRNGLVTGFRSALLFLTVYGLWYAIPWKQGFLIAIVPVVFSIMLGKLPHPEVILKKIVIGTAVGIPVGLVVFVFLAQAPSAYEMLILAAAPPLFFGLMGLTSLVSFPYSLGFNLSYMILVLPMNSTELTLNVSFAVERSLSVLVGAAILALYYIVFPRNPVMKPGTPPARLFDEDIRDVLLSTRNPASGVDVLSDRVGLILDKAVAASAEVDPATKAVLIDKAGESIFLMTQVHKVERHLAQLGMKARSRHYLMNWKKELHGNYLNDTQHHAYSLSECVEPMALPDDLSINDTRVSRTYYLHEIDNLIHRVFGSNLQQEAKQ